MRNKPLISVHWGQFPHLPVPGESTASQQSYEDTVMEASSWVIDKVSALIEDAVALVFDQGTIRPVKVYIKPLEGQAIPNEETALAALRQRAFHMDVQLECDVDMPEGESEHMDMSWRFGGDARALDSSENPEWRKNLVEGLAMSLITRMDMARKHSVKEDVPYEVIVSIADGTIQTKVGE